MNKFNVFNRRKKIEEELRKTQYNVSIWLKEMRVLQMECNHEITITVESKSASISRRKKTRTYCLLCGAHLAPRKYLPKELLEKIIMAVNINITDDRISEEKLEELYKNLKENNGDKTGYEIGEMLKKELGV